MQPTWVLVADRVRARLFSVSEDSAELAELEDFVNPEGRSPGAAFGSDQPPRVMESMGSTRHAIEPHTTPQEKVEERFARDLRKALERGRVEQRYQRLVLAAPPHFLGVLRHVLGKHVCDCVVAELGKDLTGMPAAEIRLHLATQLRS